MSFLGHVENGKVVFDGTAPLPDGTNVRIEAVDDLSGFWRPQSLDELARRQGVAPLESSDDLLGGWPADELADGFEAALRQWREQERDDQA